jgi:hypothetical protein
VRFDSGGKRIAPAAILYHAEAEWTGRSMLSQKPARVLMDRQIDFDILPCDVFAEPDRYRTVLGKELTVNGLNYKVLIVPYAEFMTECTVKAVIELKRAGFPVWFVEGLPSGVVDGDNRLIAELAECKVVGLDRLADELSKIAVPELTAEPAFPMLRYLHYRDEFDLFLLTNEIMAETFRGTVTVPLTGLVYGYDAWRNELFEIRAEQHASGTALYLEIPPYQSVVVVFDQAEGKIRPALQYDDELLLQEGWTMSLARAKEYPHFHDPQEIAGFADVGLTYPEFSGYIRYENTVDIPVVRAAALVIEDAYEGVEVFVNGEPVGIQVAPPFRFEIGSAIKPGKNHLRIEVATTLERERHFAPPIPGDFFAMLAKAPVLAPTGIVGEVKLLLKK